MGIVLCITVAAIADELLARVSGSLSVLSAFIVL